MAVYKCPVCEGRGEVEKQFYDGPCGEEGNQKVPCRSCLGTGIIQDTEYPPVVSPPDPYKQKPVVPWYPTEPPIKPYHPQWPYKPPTERPVIPWQSPHGGMCACPQCVPAVICDVNMMVS